MSVRLSGSLLEPLSPRVDAEEVRFQRIFGPAGVPGAPKRTSPGAAAFRMCSHVGGAPDIMQFLKAFEDEAAIFMIYRHIYI